MVVRWMVPVVVLLLASVAPAQAAEPPVVLGHGTVAYSIVKDGIPPTCAGEGPFTVTYEPTVRYILVAGTALGCVPIWSLISNCNLLPDRTIRCFHSGIDITFAPDGRFDYVWHDSDFHEEIHGQLARTG